MFQHEIFRLFGKNSEYSGWSYGIVSIRLRYAIRLAQHTFNIARKQMKGFTMNVFVIVHIPDNITSQLILVHEVKKVVPITQVTKKTVHCLHFIVVFHFSWRKFVYDDFDTGVLSSQHIHNFHVFVQYCVRIFFVDVIGAYTDEKVLDTRGFFTFHRHFDTC